jgi:hypothetical protein
VVFGNYVLLVLDNFFLAITCIKLSEIAFVTSVRSLFLSKVQGKDFSFSLIKKKIKNLTNRNSKPQEAK